VRLIATDFYTLYNPSHCRLRVYLQHQGVEGDPPSEFEMVVERLGQRHEEEHLNALPEAVDLRDGSIEERFRRTQRAVAECAAALYQPLLRTEATVAGVHCDISGAPDFFVRDGDEYIVRDSKLARRISKKDRPEIISQMSLYSWLFERTFGRAARRLEIHSGSSDLVEVENDHGATAVSDLEKIVLTRSLETEPYSPVGWSKCGGCRYKRHCWEAAEKSKDIARIAKIDQGLAIALREEGVITPQQLIERFDDRRLADFRRPWGKGLRRVGREAGRILTMARILGSGEMEVLSSPQIPAHANYVMFDLEGLPPFIDELEKIYLWGMKVCGENPSGFIPAVAGFGPNGDQEGWFAFLDTAAHVFEDHGDIPFVHWHHYERTKLCTYVERYGDREGIAARVEENLLDLHPITESSLALPIPSYSLKVVEKHVGFERKLVEAEGTWSMATFIEATETENEAKRQQMMDQILLYNEEDLDATWAVLQWLQGIVDNRC
jgi:predicted RecB family nuclease